MKVPPSVLRAILTVFLLLCLQRAPGQAPPPIQKIEIQHVGPAAVSDELVRANIRTKVGDPYTKANVDEDIRNLKNTGYFYNIQVGARTSDQGVTLIYVVQAKPLLTDIKFEGNKKFRSSTLLKKVTSKKMEPLDERKIFADQQEILKKYQKAGFQKTKVEYKVNVEESAGKGTVIFQIEESPKVQIQKVEFVGAQAFSQRKLRRKIKTRSHWMFSWLTGSGRLKDEQFEDDKEKLADFYRNAGYIDFEIKDIQFEQRDPKHQVIRFIISEGRQYKVGSVEFKGNKLFSTEDVIKGLRTREGVKTKSGLNLPAGATFTPKGLSKDIQAIEDFYGSHGYIDVRYPGRLRVIKTPNIERGTMDLTYELDEGEKSYIEKVEIRGNTKTKDRVIRRELAVAPGEVFDMVRVKRSKSRLEQMQFFEKVEAQPEPTDIPERKNLAISVEEKNTGNFILGAGFSSVDNLVGFVEVSQGNFDLFNPPFFTGAGQKFRLRTQLGTQRKDYEITFEEPYFFGRKVRFGVDLYYREFNFLSSVYDESELGGRLSLTRTLGSEFLIGGISYTLEDIGILDVKDKAPKVIKEEEGHRMVSKMGASLAYDTRNNVILPDKGQRTELVAEVAGGPFGFETDFYKIELRTMWYFKGFYEGHILEVGGKSGVVDSYGGSDRVPFFDRWFLGGAYNLRGFSYRDVGPHDRGEPIGGNTYVYGTLEYSVPIIERLRFALFYDIGNVYADAYDFNIGDYVDNWGIGLRLNLPIGPLRLDYGIPINRGPDNRGGGKFQFTVGYQREF